MAMTVKYDQKPGYKGELVGHDFINYIKAPNRASLPLPRGEGLGVFEI